MALKHMNVALFVPHEGCPRQCSFCNQRSITGKVERLTAYDIERAVKTACRFSSAGPGIKREIAFFGGSFTAINREYMLELLKAASKYIDGKHFTGIRISTRPDAIDSEICEILQFHGVTAVELGAQSMDDSVLEINRRGHTSKDIENAADMVKKHGFELGLQIMTGLYGSSPEESMSTANKIIKLKPATVRIYPTIVLHGTPLAALLTEGKYTPQPLEEAVSLCASLLELFYNEGIEVIRLGLHSGGDVLNGYIAGPYHPAFRELCEGEIYLRKARKALKEAGIRGGAANLYVAEAAISQMTGQKRANIAALKSDGYECRVIPHPGLKKYEVAASIDDATTPISRDE